MSLIEYCIFELLVPQDRKPMNSIIWCRVGFLVAQRYFLKNGQNWPILTPPGGTPLGGQKWPFFKLLVHIDASRKGGPPRWVFLCQPGVPPTLGVPPQVY